MPDTTDTTTTTTFDLYVFGSRAAATAALTSAIAGGKVDHAAETMRAAFVAGDVEPKRIAGRICAAAKRAGMPAASPTILARRIPEIVKGASYGTMPYGDGDRTIVFVPTGGALPTARTLKANGAKRLKAAAPAIRQAKELAGPMPASRLKALKAAA